MFMRVCVCMCIVLESGDIFMTNKENLYIMAKVIVKSFQDF